MTARRCTTDDAATATAILVDAFYDDPTWGWVFPDPASRREQQGILWDALVGGAIGYGSVWLDADATATAVWIPPGQPELNEAQEADLVRALTDNLGAQITRVVAVMQAFEDAHPHHEPHFTLSLLGTRTAHRGQGLGLQLLAETLEVVDAAAMPAYLEASNPVNIALYERYGFELFGSFELPGDGADVATMWRPAQPRAGS